MYSMISLIFANWYLSYVIIVGIVHVNGKALFEKSDQIDLSQNYDDYQIQGLSARSLTDCAAICHNFVDCRAVLMNHGTGFCRVYDTDISQYAGTAVLPNDTFSFLRGKAVKNCCKLHGSVFVMHREMLMELQAVMEGHGLNWSNKSSLIIGYFTVCLDLCLKAIDLVAGQGDNAWQVGTIIPTEGFPYLALDGNTNGWWSQGSCMHTNDVYGPWWAVDIGGYAKIGKIKIYQRRDTCCVDRFANIKFMVADTQTDINNNNGTVIATYVGPASTTPFPLVINASTGVKGRYLKVYKDAGATRENLAFCEIEVFPF